jgi:hypothetical protein
MAELESVESQLKKLESTSGNSADLQKTLRAALAKLQTIRGDDNPDLNQPQKEIGLAEANAGLGVALRVVESGDRPAPAQALAIFDDMKRAANEQIAAWQRFKVNELAKVNADLQRAHQAPLEISAIEEQVHYAMTR